MNRSKQSYVVLLGLAFVLLTAVACSDSSDGGMLVGVSDEATTLDMNGTWSFIADAAAPPTVTTCTDELSGLSMNLWPSFTVMLTQVGSDVSGAVIVPCVTQSFDSHSSSDSVVSLSYSGTQSSGCLSSEMTLQGSLSGSVLSGMLVSEVSGTTYRTAFTGSVARDSGQLTAMDVRADGMNGTCTAGGSYLVSR